MWPRPRNREDGGEDKRTIQIRSAPSMTNSNDHDHDLPDSRFHTSSILFSSFPTSPPVHQTIKNQRSHESPQRRCENKVRADVAMAQAEKSRLHGTHQWDLGFEPRGARRRGARAWTMVGLLEAYARLTQSIRLNTTHHSPSSQ